jgi:hypothetical protein
MRQLGFFAHRPWLRIACGIVLVGAFDRGIRDAWAQAQPPFVPNEQRVTRESEILDPEYSQRRAQFTWVDRTGKLWIGNIDRKTGLFSPADGRGILVDAAAMSANSIAIVGNGPEWISTATGDQIVYTRFLPDLPPSLTTARLAIATERSDRSWTAVTLDDRTRNGPYASRDPADPQPRISYIDDLGNHYWRNVFDPASETLIPGYPPNFWVSMRFVAKLRAALFRGPDAQGVTQVYRHWLDSGSQEQLTADGGHADALSSVWMWPAPEFNGAFVMATVANANTEIRIYRKADPEQGFWSVVHRIPAPAGGTISSPEPFIYQGRSYLLMSINPPGALEPTGIAVASIDPARPLFRKVTPNDDTRIRKDPELFVTDSGPFLYYNRFNPAFMTDPDRLKLIVCDKCNEGIWRSNISAAIP